MTLPTGANPLPPPPLTGNRKFDSWARELYRKVGEANIEAPIKSTNITGVLASANAAPGMIKNQTNDGLSDSVDAGSDATVRVYGPGGVGSNWTLYRNVAPVNSYPAVTFTGKAYATRYYIGFNTATGSWLISTSYKDVTGDNVISFSVKTVAAGGAGGVGGGGGTGAGGVGGADSSDRAGYGLML